MRARIIFRGLTLFEFERLPEPGKDAGQMTAYLVTDPKHNGNPQHEHRPFLGIIGRDRDDVNGPGRAEAKRPLNSMRVELKGHGLKGGVVVDESFLRYVPGLADLTQSAIDKTIDTSEFITRRIVIPTGRVRARNFISWDWCGNTPARVAYMDTDRQGFGANEVIVDIGDDSDMDAPDHDRFLQLSGAGMHQEELWPRSRGAASDYDVDPNTVEVSLTNLTIKRRRPVFWGLHFQTLFDAAGYPRKDAYADQAQYEAFRSAADAYDPFEWRSDSAMAVMRKGVQPFPFLIEPRRDVLDAIETRGPGMVTQPPPTIDGTRGKNDGIPKDKSSKGSMPNMGGGAPPAAGGSMGSMSSSSTSTMAGMSSGTGDDPENTEICPFAHKTAPT